MEKRKPFFTGYRPQFYFRTEENKKKFGERGERFLPKAPESTESAQRSEGRKGSGCSYE